MYTHFRLGTTSQLHKPPQDLRVAVRFTSTRQDEGAARWADRLREGGHREYHVRDIERRRSIRNMDSIIRLAFAGDAGKSCGWGIEVLR